MKLKTPRIYFSPVEGSAPLSIYWFDGPKGDGIEAINQTGVGFFGATGELLGVIFDDVSQKKDFQFLEFDRFRVEIKVSSGKISYKLNRVPSVKKSPRAAKSISPRA